MEYEITEEQSKVINDNLNEEFASWFRKAQSDLRKVELLMNGKEYDGALFYAQQSAEKALKALHIFNGFGLIKTHELPSMCKKLKAPDNVLRCAIYLNPFEKLSRYPDEEDVLFNEDSAKEALRLAKEVLGWCKLSKKISE
jgi:HEPN domain-containing protein